MNALERRLVAALDARATLVTLEDLRPPAPPSGPRVNLRRLAAATGIAAVVLAVACLVLLGQFRDDRGSRIQPLAPPARSSSVATEAPTPVASPTPARSDSARTASPLASVARTAPTRTVSSPRMTATRGG